MGHAVLHFEFCENKRVFIGVCVRGRGGTAEPYSVLWNLFVPQTLGRGCLNVMCIHAPIVGQMGAGFDNQAHL